MSLGAILIWAQILGLMQKITQTCLIAFNTLSINSLGNASLLVCWFCDPFSPLSARTQSKHITSSDYNELSSTQSCHIDNVFQTQSDLHLCEQSLNLVIAPETC